MTCREFRDWLEDVERSHEPRAGWSHVEGCAEAQCRSLWEEFLVVDEAVAAWKADVPQADVLDRVWREVQRPAATRAVSHRIQSTEEGSSPRRQANRRGWIVVALSSALVAVSLWGLSIINRQPQLNPSVPGIAEAPAVDAAPVEPPLQKYSVASVNLAQSASAFVADAALLTVHDVGDPDDPSRPVSAWATRVGRQLQPLGEKVNGALQYIDAVIPDMSLMRMMPTG